MLKPDYTTVIKQYNAWYSGYDANNTRGKESILFTDCDDQWKEDIVGIRSASNKESMVFNLCLKISKKLKAQAREIDFSLDLWPTNPDIQNRVEENSVFKLILQNIVLSNEFDDKAIAAFDKCADFGYSFLEVNFKRQDENTLNCIPDIKFHEDPSIAFWDKNAMHPCKIDGRFCGMRRLISKEALLSKFNIRDPGYLKDVDNEFIDYWFRDYKNMNFILLKSGVYKREDLLNDMDKDNIATEEDIADKKDMQLVQSCQVCCIYFMQFCNGRILTESKEFPTNDLPLIYHFGCTVWVKDDSQKTFPVTFHLQGAQRLHNYLNSQIATTARGSGDDKWFVDPAAIIGKAQEKEMKDINARGGVFQIPPSSVQRQQGVELSMSMIQMAQQTKQEIDEIAGAMMDMQTTDQTVVSRVALDKITHNIGLHNISLLGRHIVFINTVGKVIIQMIPKITTEERIILVKRQDGTAMPVVINQDVGTGTIRNNIKDLVTNFDYEIKAGPSSSMQKENNLKALMAAYQIDQTIFRLTADIWARNLENSDAAEITRRLAVTYVDNDLIKYSQGEISLEQYQKLAAQKAAQQMQQQTQMMNSTPEAQGAMGMAQAEQAKAQSMQYDSQTKRMTAIGTLHQKQQQMHIDLMDTLEKNDQAAAQQEIDKINAQLEATQKMIDTLKMEEQDATV